MQAVGERCEHRERDSYDGSFLQIGSDRLLAGLLRTRDFGSGPRKYFIFSGSMADKEG
jgi:hypothetical protein